MDILWAIAALLAALLLLAILLVGLLPGPFRLLGLWDLHPDLPLSAALKHQAQGGRVLPEKMSGLLVLRPQHHLKDASLAPGQLHSQIT